jgi:hypothetical protein
VRLSSAFFVYAPCLSALVLLRGAPDPLAPPCMRQRFLPATVGERHGVPPRVFAPQRGLASIGAVFRSCFPVFLTSHYFLLMGEYGLNGFGVVIESLTERGKDDGAFGGAVEFHQTYGMFGVRPSG